GFEAENEVASEHFDHGRYAEAREVYRAMLARAKDLVDRAADADRPRLLTWAARCQLNVAAATMNLQEVDEAKDLLSGVDPNLLPIKGRLNLAEAVALIGDLDRAE